MVVRAVAAPLLVILRTLGAWGLALPVLGAASVVAQEPALFPEQGGSMLWPVSRVVSDLLNCGACLSLMWHIFGIKYFTIGAVWLSLVAAVYAFTIHVVGVTIGAELLAGRGVSWGAAAGSLARAAMVWLPLTALSCSLSLSRFDAVSRSLLLALAVLVQLAVLPPSLASPSSLLDRTPATVSALLGAFLLGGERWFGPYGKTPCA